MVASRESADLARHLIEATARKHGIDEGTLTLHADRGSSIGGQPVPSVRRNSADSRNGAPKIPPPGGWRTIGRSSTSA